MARKHPDAIAWHNLADGSDLSFRVWDAQANRLARGLVRRGLRPEERVVIAVGPDEPFPWLISYAAVHRAGAVAVPVNTRLAGPELRAIVAHADPTVVLASPTTGGGTSGSDLVERAAGLRVLAITASGSKATDWSALFDPDASALAPAGDAGVAMDIMYTSGTTGAPKAVVVRHDLPTEAGPPPDWYGLGFMTSSPFSTTSGALLVYGPMGGGLSGWYQPRFDPGDWLALVEGRRPVVAFIVPAMAQLIVAHPRFTEADLSSLAALTIGGAPVARATLRRLGDQLPKADVLVGYGLTEFGAVTRSPSGDMGRHLGSVGRPLPGVEIRIVNAEGDGMAAGQVGEITVRGTEPPRRYYKAESETRLTWRDGWMHSGDLGYLDDEGFLWITGRIKDLIIRGGHNIAPGEIEEVLFSHPAVIDAVAAGIPHDVLGEDVGAWVVLQEGSPSTAAELRGFMLERLADYKVPRQLHLVDRLPRNDAGKVVRAALEMPSPEPTMKPYR
jgi:acyl-CoA synthetase (AMP-forming)/AMP-acid ligase II